MVRVTAASVIWWQRWHDAPEMMHNPGLLQKTPHASPLLAQGGSAREETSAKRIVPDAMRSLAAGEPVPVRRPQATRPWQQVLKPLGGYHLLA